MAQVQATLLGKLIKKLINLLRAHNEWSQGKAISYVATETNYSDSTVHRWCTGELQPPDDTLKTLARLGKEEAKLNRDWGDSLFRAANYPTPEPLLDEIWGRANIVYIPNNLPKRAHTAFIGREKEMADLFTFLHPSHRDDVICVDGIGGVGKTALVLEVAYRCLEASTGEKPNPAIPLFDAILVASAKEKYLSEDGIIPIESKYQQRTVQDIILVFVRTLENHISITPSMFENNLDRLGNILGNRRILLIVDNLETLDEKHEIFDFLFHLPRQVRVVTTSRERASIYVHIRLESLPEEDGLELIHHETSRQSISLSEEQAKELYQRSGGIPAAIIYATGQIHNGHSADIVLERMVEHNGDIAYFCFEESISPLRGKPAHHLLMALSVFPMRPIKTALAKVAGLLEEIRDLDNGLAELQRLSLVTEQDGRYNMLALTREYARGELARHPDFEHEARQRWVSWYLEFTSRYGGDDWQEWHIPYDALEREWVNISAALAWCAVNNEYDKVIALWRHLAGFTNLYGYWEDRLGWLNWIIQSAEQRADWETAVEAMSDKGFTLLLMSRAEQYEKAEEILKQAWTLSAQADPAIRSRIASNMALLRVRQGELSDALQWCEHSLNALSTSDPTQPEFIRNQLPALYYQAEIHYRRGEYDRAATQFEKLMEHAESIKWQRAVNYIENWLADIAIMRSDLIGAECKLEAGLKVASRNKDKRRVGFYKRSLAYLEYKRNHWGKAQTWAEAALDTFVSLPMECEAEEMRKLIHSLKITK